MCSLPVLAGREHVFCGKCLFCCGGGCFIFGVLLPGNSFSVQNGISGKLSSMEDVRNDLFCSISRPGVEEFGTEA